MGEYLEVNDEMFTKTEARFRKYLSRKIKNVDCNKKAHDSQCLLILENITIDQKDHVKQSHNYQINIQ
jgi:hypothetical protein